MSCKGLCDRYKIHVVRRNSGPSYYSEESPDNKFCSRCQCRLIWSGIMCPCCNFKLRTKPRNYKMTETTNNNHIPNKLTELTNSSNTIILNEPVDDLEILLPMPFVSA